MALTNYSLIKQQSASEIRKGTTGSQYSSTGRGRPPASYMGQHASATFDSIKKQDLIDGNLQSRSALRRQCYRMKHAMIVSSLRNLFTSTVAGFVFNLPLMGSIVIVYEKVSLFLNIMEVCCMCLTFLLLF